VRDRRDGIEIDDDTPSRLAVKPPFDPVVEVHRCASGAAGYGCRAACRLSAALALGVARYMCVNP